MHRKHSMQSYFLLALLLMIHPVLSRADDAHGGEGSDFEYSNSNSDFEFGSYGTQGGDPVADDPYYVPSEVRDLFEDYALRTQAEARAKVEKDKTTNGLNWDNAIDGVGQGKMVVVEKKTVRKVSAPVVVAPIGSGTQNRTGGTPAASATISQNIAPAVLVNNIITGSSKEEKSTAENVDSEKAIEKSAENNPRKVFKPLWLEAQQTPSAEKNIVNVIPVRGSSSGWIDKLRGWWFDRANHPAKTATTRRLIVTAEEEVPSFDPGAPEVAPQRKPSQATPDITSSQSWFGWIGWVVALMLLGLLLVRTKKELV